MRIRARWTLSASLFSALLFGSLLALAEAPALVVVFDASGSMWGRVQREEKIVIARRALGEIVDGLADDARVGLIAYGHRRKGDCGDIETVAPLGPLDRAGLKRLVNRLDPKGKTPITDSVRRAFDLVKAHEGGATVVLLSDGLETCGGDPCAAVREAKLQGIDFLLHVVGFDVAKEDVSQLECAAQAGGGLFFSADNAGQLGDALRAAVALGPQTAAGRLSLKAVADGRLQDVSVRVFGDAGEPVARARTYANPDTNPRLIPLPDGSFEVRVQAVGLEGADERRFGIEIADGSTVEREVDFSTGEMVIGATRDGRLSDALYKVYRAGQREVVVSGRTYALPSRNPASLRIVAGEYDLTLSSVEIDDHPERRFEGLLLEPGGKLDVSHDWESGTLRIGALRGGQLIDALVQVSRVSDGKAVTQGRAYASPDSNPRDFILRPGRYSVRVTAIRLPGRPSQEFEIELTAGETSARPADFSQ